MPETFDLKALEKRMDGAIASLKTEFSGLRTGRASVHLLDTIHVMAYGASTPLNQVAFLGRKRQRLHRSHDRVVLVPACEVGAEQDAIGALGFDQHLHVWPGLDEAIERHLLPDVVQRSAEQPFGPRSLLHRHFESTLEPGGVAAGMGDVLTGVAAGIAGQLSDPRLAARAAVLVHAMAGDRAAASLGERGLLASDVIAQLPACVNPA